MMCWGFSVCHYLSVTFNHRVALLVYPLRVLEHQCMRVHFFFGACPFLQSLLKLPNVGHRLVHHLSMLLHLLYSLKFKAISFRASTSASLHTRFKNGFLSHFLVSPHLQGLWNLHVCRNCLLLGHLPEVRDLALKLALELVVLLVMNKVVFNVVQLPLRNMFLLRDNLTLL